MDKKTNNKSNLFNWLFKDINLSFLTSNKSSQPFIQKKNKNTKIYSKMNSQYDEDQSFNKNELNLSSRRIDPFTEPRATSKIDEQNFLKSKEEKSNKKLLNTSSSKSRFIETSKQQVVSITYEEIGLFPRSFNRVFDRFFKQLFFDVENLVIQEYRFYRYLFLTTVKCVFILLFVPLTINFIAKNYFVRPITEYYWNSHQMEIFLNSYQQKKAFTELKNFEEKIYFESLIFPINSSICLSSCLPENKNEDISFAHQSLKDKGKQNLNEQDKMKQNSNFSQMFTQSIQKRLQLQTVELAKHYNEESIEAITNFFADLISLSTLFVLLKRLEIQINITKSFLLEVFFGLDDSKKSLLILFITDLLVGYHSPNIWELFFSTIFDHYGLPESQTTIFLLVATLPVLLDVLFKYLIFRHLNRASPATVATYHAMIE